MRIGLAQMNSQGSKKDNLLSAETLIRALAGSGAELVMLPEHFSFIGPDSEKRNQAEPMNNSASLEMIRDCAAELRIYIHLGSFLEKEGDHVFNTAVVVDPSGDVIARYRKIHLFDVEIPGGRKYLESDTISAGRETVLFSVGDFVFGLATCYDLRFPELFRSLVGQGANILLLPAAFTEETGRDHWELLLRARAVENQCWVAAAGQWGTAPPNHASYGRSMVINPWGVVVAQAGDGVTAVTAELDLDILRSVRTAFPALTHVRRDLF
jgi:predicted amidohydrolase